MYYFAQLDQSLIYVLVKIDLDHHYTYNPIQYKLVHLLNMRQAILQHLYRLNGLIVSLLL